MNLDNYVDVPTRLKLALDRWPDLRVQETGREIVQLGDQQTIIVTVTVWRSADDPIPAIATASEPLPGKTPFTRDSELMNGATSALGRALGYMGIGLETSIASRNEIEARQASAEKHPSNQPSRLAEVRPIGPGPITDAQKRMLRALGHAGPFPTSKKEASDLITDLKAKAYADAPAEDPF